MHAQLAATFLRAHMLVEYMLKAAKKETKVSMEKQVSYHIGYCNLQSLDVKDVMPALTGKCPDRHYQLKVQ